MAEPDAYPKDSPAARTTRSADRLHRVVPAAIFSTALASAIVAGGKVVYSGDATAPLSVNRLTDFRLVDILLALLLAAAITAVVAQTPRLIAWFDGLDLSTHVPSNGAQGWRLVLASALGLMLAWSPYLLAFAPGWVNADARFSIRQALFAGVTQRWDNHHPIAYALFLRGLLWAGALTDDINVGVFVITCVQYVLMAGILGYSLVWLLRRHAPVALVVGGFVFFALVPLFPLFAVGISKDSLFAALALLYSLHLFDVVASEGALLRTARGLTVFVVLSLLILFCRNNGFLLVVGAGLALAVTYRGSIKPMYFALACVLLLTAFVQGPIYNRLKTHKPVVESLGIPIQQLAYVIATNGDIAEKDADFLATLLPMQEWRASYQPALVDSLKAHPEFDREYLAEHRREFLQTWFAVLTRNPGAYVRAYALATFGYWKPFVGFQVAPPTPGVIENELGITPVALVPRDVQPGLTGFLTTLIRSRFTELFVNVGLAVWLFFLSATALVMIGRSRYLVALTPCFFSWLGFMVATPIAFNLRYLFMFLTCLPFIVLLPLIVVGRHDTGASSGTTVNDVPGEGVLSAS